MKTMTCRQLGGGCDETFQAETFEEITQISQKHGKEMAMKGDTAHLEAMNSIKELMSSPKAMQAWMEEKRRLFDSLSEK